MDCDTFDCILPHLSGALAAATKCGAVKCRKRLVVLSVPTDATNGNSYQPWFPKENQQHSSEFVKDCEFSAGRDWIECNTPASLSRTVSSQLGETGSNALFLVEEQPKVWFMSSSRFERCSCPHRETTDEFVAGCGPCGRSKPTLRNHASGEHAMTLFCGHLSQRVCVGIVVL